MIDPVSAEVYDLLTVDPREEHDVSRTQAAAATAMAARVDAIRARALAAPAPALSTDAQERLRSLGYVASTTAAIDESAAPNPAGGIADWNAFEDALSSLSTHRSGALDALRALAVANPDAPLIQTTYARALTEARQFGAALAIYRRAAERWPTDATVLHDLAVAAREAAGAACGAAAQALHDEVDARRSSSVDAELEQRAGPQRRRPAGDRCQLAWRSRQSLSSARSPSIRTTRHVLGESRQRAPWVWRSHWRRAGLPPRSTWTRERPTRQTDSGCWVEANRPRRGRALVRTRHLPRRPISSKRGRTSASLQGAGNTSGAAEASPSQCSRQSSARKDAQSKRWTRSELLGEIASWLMADG
jgi:hypothetical protein